AGDGADAVFLVAAVRQVVRQRRDVEQRRRADPLARDADAATRLRADDPAGPVRDHQARGLAHAHLRDGPALREALAMSMENFAPLMFAGLILIMLIGFPVAFSL